MKIIFRVKENLKRAYGSGLINTVGAIHELPLRIAFPSLDSLFLFLDPSYFSNGSISSCLGPVTTTSFS
jgi:hypothetical protein